MMKQNVLLANAFQQIRHLWGKAQAARVKGGNFRSGRGVWSPAKTGGRDSPVLGLEYLPRMQPELMSQGSTISAGALASISSRTTSPLRRLCS